MPSRLVEQALRRELTETFKDPNYQPPPLPSVAVKLASLARDDDADVHDVVRLLEQDQMLAGLVLRLVSSPVYAARSPITSLRQAVVRVGLKTLRSIVFEASLRRGVFDLPDYRETLEQVLRHSTTSAYITRLICVRCGADPESGFLAALLHDIGFSGLLFSRSSVQGRESPKLEQLWRDFDDAHERASNLLARLWSLPPDICEVLGHHHHFDLCTNAVASRIAAAVCVADELTGRFGANIVGAQDADGNFIAADGVVESTLESARALLGLDDKKLDAVLEAAEEIIPEILWV